MQSVEGEGDATGGIEVSAVQEYCLLRSQSRQDCRAKSNLTIAKVAIAHFEVM
jgi:hypothetical protein